VISIWRASDKELNSMTNLTIIIPNYNGKSYLENCFNSLNFQNYIFDVIIVDNGSEDGSVKYIKENHPQYTLIENKENLGFSKAVNQGVKASHTDYVFLLNNDAELDQNCVSNLLECMGDDDEIFAVSSKMIQYHNREKLDDAGDEYSILGWTKKTGEDKPIQMYSKKREIFSACAGAALYRRDVFDKIGLFDENFFAYLEDVDISYRARIHGFKCVYCPEAVVYHHTSGTSGSKYNEFKIKLAARNNVYLPYKNMPWPQLAVNSIFLLVGYLIKYFFFIRKGQGKYYINGLKEGFTSLNRIEKVKYNHENLTNYFNIEYLLLKNIFKFLN
jgi:GT2 family glycosyltransferase